MSHRVLLQSWKIDPSKAVLLRLLREEAGIPTEMGKRLVERLLLGSPVRVSFSVEESAASFLVHVRAVGIEAELEG